MKDVFQWQIMIANDGFRSVVPENKTKELQEILDHYRDAYGCESLIKEIEELFAEE